MIKILRIYLSISALKFGSDAAPSFQGKNLFSQPLKAEESKTEESKPVSSPLLAKGIFYLSNEVSFLTSVGYKLVPSIQYLYR